MLKSFSADRWNYDTAAHLLNRAGFGGTPVEIQKLAGYGPDKAVSSLIDYENIPDPTPAPVWAVPDPEGNQRLRDAAQKATPEERRQIQQQQQRLQFERLMELRGWWLNRMAKGPRPFQEKMVLFWHGHFATSFEKVRNAYYMWRQNELFRRLATGNWLDCSRTPGKDPAMLIWLDQAQSRKAHPNENFAREVMELFSLGEGHYTEKDVTEAARALTGWSLDRLTEKFIYRPLFHDNGVKTFLGRTGNLNGDDVMAQIVAQPQAARFITAKLWNYFAGQPPADSLNDALAAVFRGSGNNFKPFLRVMFRSEEFYDDAIIRNEVKSPVQWLVGSASIGGQGGNGASAGGLVALGGVGSGTTQGGSVGVANSGNMTAGRWPRASSRNHRRRRRQWRHGLGPVHGWRQRRSSGANGGVVSVTNSGDIATGTNGAASVGSQGIIAQSIGGGGGNGGGSIAFVPGSPFSAAFGGSGGAGGAGGNVTIGLDNAADAYTI